MEYTLLKSKIHRAVVTQAELNYVGSITIDAELMRKADICEYEKVQVVDIDNGERLETYVIAGEAGSGIICLNGAAARKVCVGDKVIIMTYVQIRKEELDNFIPKVVFVGMDNKIERVCDYEKHGEIG